MQIKLPVYWVIFDTPIDQIVLLSIKFRIHFKVNYPYYNMVKLNTMQGGL
jgi:hypothetical protein